MANADISHLLKEWIFESGGTNARIISGKNGLSKLQIRLELGVLQLEMEGRPDGKTPSGASSLLEHHQRRLTKDPDGSAPRLTAEECRELREEAVQFHHRYVALFALGEFVSVVRDTSHNLMIFDLCLKRGSSEQDRSMLEGYRANVITVRARAAAELCMQAGSSKDAMSAINAGLQELAETFEQQGRAEAFDQSNEVQLLLGMRDLLTPKLPASQRIELEDRLQKALANENYELAAILRDELRQMRN